MKTVSGEEQANELERLKALMLENDEPDPMSEEEARLLALGADLGDPSALGNPTIPEGGVPEDYVDLNIPGYAGNTPPSSAGGSVAVSPMLSIGSMSTAVSRGGGFGRGSDGKKFCVVLILKGKGVCLSDIGDGAKFCLKVGCTVASHKGANKFDPTDEGSVVIAKGRDVAFASPVLGGTVLPQSVLHEWGNDAKTLEEWNELFKASQQDLNFTSSAEHEARLREHQISESYKTPAKKKGQSSSFLITGLENLSLYSQAIDSRHKDSFQKGNPGRVSEVVLGVDAALHELSKSFLKHVRETQDAVSALEMADAMLELHKNSAASLMGSISQLSASPFQSPTVFGTLASLARKVEQMSLVGPPIVDFSPMQAEVSRLRQETKKVQNLSIDLTVKLSNKVKALESWRRGGASAVPQVSFNPPVTTPSPAASVLLTSPSSDSLKRVEMELAKLVSRIELMEIENSDQRLEIQRLTAEGDESAIKFSGLGMKTIEETGSWIDLNSPGGSFDFALIPDAYFILELAAGDGEASQSAMLKTLNSLRTLNLDSEYQAKTLAAFQLEVPRFFHGTKDVGGFASGVGESQLGNLPTYKIWSQGQGSKKKLLDRKLPNIRASFRNLIINSLMHSNPRVYNLAIEALERSISWITNLSSWMDRAYENAHIASKMSAAKSWALVTQLVRRVFSEIFVVRMGTIQAMAANDRRSMRTGVLWSVFRTHDKMTEFEDVNFEDHPAIASEHIKFLACNSGFDMLDALEKDVGSLKSDAKELDRKVTLSVKKADSASTQSDLNKKAISDLTKRVDKK